MRIKMWGVRGSIPSPGPDTVEFGGNTSCYEVRAGDALIVIWRIDSIAATADSASRESQRQWTLRAVECSLRIRSRLGQD